MVRISEPLQKGLEITLPWGEGCPEASGFRLRPRPEVRDRTVLSPEAVGNAVALILADLARREQFQQ
jgi:hypothetical protein